MADFTSWEFHIDIDWGSWIIISLDVHIELYTGDGLNGHDIVSFGQINLLLL
jgi:hypothetical protein